MAKGKKTGGRNFERGKSGNPSGPKPIPEDIKEARKLNQFEFERAANKFLYMDESELEASLANPRCILMEKIVGNIAKAAYYKADQQRMEFFLNRLIGKVQDRIEVTTPVPFVIHKSDGSQIICGTKTEDKADGKS